MLPKKRFSLLSVFVMMAFVAALLAVVAALLANRRLVAEIEAGRDLAESRHTELRQLIDSHEAELADLHKATMLLAKLNDIQEYSGIVEFIRAMNGNSLACSVRVLSESDNIALFVYHLPFVLDDGSPRPVFDRKSVQVLADADSLKVVDVIMHAGYRTESKSTSDPWQTCYDFADGTRVEYRILTTGFEPIEDVSQ